MRLADEIALYGVSVAKGAPFDTAPDAAYLKDALRKLQPVIAKTPVFVADDIARAWLAAEAYRPSVWDIHALPTIAPIYPRMLIEFARPSDMHVDLPPQMGMFIECAPVHSLSDHDAIALLARAPGAYWLMRVLLLMGVHERRVPVFCVASLNWTLDAGGRFNHELGSRDSLATVGDAVNSGTWSAYRESLLTALMVPSLLALCFLHANSVNVVYETPSGPLAKSFRQRHQIEPRSYQRIGIAAVLNHLRSKGNIDEQGMQTAIANCESHFGDHRYGVALFPANKTEWWWQ